MGPVPRPRVEMNVGGCTSCDIADEVGSGSTAIASSIGGLIQIDGVVGGGAGGSGGAGVSGGAGMSRGAGLRSGVGTAYGAGDGSIAGASCRAFRDFGTGCGGMIDSCNEGGLGIGEGGARVANARSRAGVSAAAGFLGWGGLSGGLELEATGA